MILNIWDSLFSWRRQGHEIARDFKSQAIVSVLRNSASKNAKTKNARNNVIDQTTKIKGR